MTSGRRGSAADRGGALWRQLDARRVWRQQGPAAALPLLQAAHDEAPDDAALAGDLAEALVALERPAEALAVLPVLPSTALRRARLAATLDRGAEAGTIFQGIAGLPQLAVDDRCLAAWCLIEAGAVDEGLALAEGVQPLLDGTARLGLLKNVVRALQRVGAWSTVLERTGAGEPAHSADLMHARVTALLMVGRIADAVAVHEAAVDDCVQGLTQQLGSNPSAAVVLESLLATADAFAEARAVYHQHVAGTPEALAQRHLRFEFDTAVRDGSVRTADADAYHALCRPAPTNRYPLVLISAVRDECDVIEGMLTWHFAQGIDAAVVIDNGSVDGTRARLAALAARWPIIVLDQPAGRYDQSRWLTRAARLAQRLLGAEWIIPADADELWVPAEGDLRHALARLIAAWPQANQFQLGTALVVPDRARGMAAGFAPLAETRVLRRPLRDIGYRYAEPERLLQPYLTQWRKCWFRADALRLIAMGNHHGLMQSPSLGYGAEVTCFHYHTRGFAHLLAKARRDQIAAHNSDAHARSAIGGALAGFAAVAEAAAHDVYHRRTWPNPVFEWFAAAGRLVEESRVAVLLAQPPVLEHLAPLPPDLVADAPEILALIDALLPELV
ncbi:MAG: glycosyltransferase family 2 protein [Alphaproteobacteria bacterium]|nr:glycosyltransferase family 2 protein [Alphaproteobacteria bacterium]